MKKSDIKSYIESNKDDINNIIAKNLLSKNMYAGFAKARIMIENQVLMPSKSGTPNNVIPLLLNYTYIQNQQSTFDYIIKSPFAVIDGCAIREVHSCLCKNTNIRGGAPRLFECQLAKLNIYPPDYNIAIQKMNDVYYYMSDANLEPVAKAMRVHFDMIAIQPFTDYNKRTTRMIMNWVLMKNHYSPIIFHHVKDRDKYLKAIAEKAKSNNGEYELFMLNTMLRTQNEFIKVLKNSQAFKAP
ncbi:MAG: Fic family protein [Rickettsiales bacterium]|jgi:hypothetical protein|nr:Fic family protein [Rickettsiales bacterium]